RRRSRVLPAAFGPGRACTRVPGGPAERRESGELPAGSRREGLVVVSASMANARLLAVPDRLDGDRTDEHYLPCAIHALSAASRRLRNGETSRLGRVRRRRDGRARIDWRAEAGRARESRQPDVRHQLQLAAARRTVARGW